MGSVPSADRIPQSATLPRETNPEPARSSGVLGRPGIAQPRTFADPSAEPLDGAERVPYVPMG